MNQLNSLILEGNLVRDAVLSEPAPGFKKCMFTMGVNRFYKNRKNEDVNEASFFDVEAYGNMADYCSEKAKKGRGVRVVGRLKQDTWKDNAGKTASRIYVVAEHIEYKPMKKTETEEAAKAEEKPAEGSSSAEVQAAPAEAQAAPAEAQTAPVEAQTAPVEEKVPVEEAVF